MTRYKNQDKDSREQGPYGSRKFWKVMEIQNDIFQDLQSFGKRKFSKCPWKSFGFLFGKIQKYPKMDVA